MSSLERFNILLERMETLNERSFKSAVSGFSKGEGGINKMLDTYENNGKPITAKSRIRNLILLRALYHTDYITYEDYEALAKLATSSTKISTLLNQLAPKAQEELFGTAQKSEEVVQYVKDNAEDLLNFGVKNLQGKNFQPREVQGPADEPTENEKEEMKDDVSSALVSLARELTSDEVKSEVLGFDEADIYIEIPDQGIKRNIASKLAKFLNDQGLEADVSGVGVNVQAPVGFFGDGDSRSVFRDRFNKKVREIDPNVPEDRIRVAFTGDDYEDTGIEDNEGNPVLGLRDDHKDLAKVGVEEYQGTDPRKVNELSNDAKREDELDDYLKRVLLNPEVEENNELENKIQAALDKEEIDERDASAIQRNSDAAFENILSPAIETARQDPDMDYAEVKGMIEAQLDRKCTEDECKDIEYELYNMQKERAIETARQDPDMTYADVKGMIEAGLDRECTEDECKDIKSGLYNMFGKEGDQERAEAVLDAEDAEDNQGIAAGRFGEMDSEEDLIFDEMENDFNDGKTKEDLQAKYGKERVKMYIKHIEGNETVTENFENQRHLNVTTNSTSMYLTEQVSKDKRNGSQNKKSSNQSQSFKERYKPKTHWQLEELRRYGL